MGNSAELESIKLSTLRDLLPTLTKPDPDIAFSISMVGSAMLGRMRSAQAVPHLSILLTSSDPSIRRAAAGNLSRIGTYAVVAPLASLALNDSSPDVRYYAVAGLSKVTGAASRPTRDTYDASESAILSFWVEWARNLH
jgi:HEAT repeat protein